MSDLTRIYQGNFFSEYSQLHLRDAASDEGVEWGRDAEEVVFGEHTAMFTVRNDANIEVNIFRGEGKPGGRLAGTGRIMVGAAGLSIGNLFTDTDLIDWPPGETEVTIYLHSSQPWLARKASIVLKSASHATSTAPTLTVNLIAERVAELLARARQPARPVNDTIANALARLGKAAIPALIDVATDTNPRVRAIAAQALGRIRDQRALDILIAALADPDTNVRDVGVYWLGPLHDRRATEPLLAALATSDTRQRSMIVRSLGQLRDQRAIEPLLSMLNDEQEDLFVREEAARSLGALKAKGALDSLARLFRQQGDHFRYAILQALLSLGKTALPLILDLAEDTDPDVRRMIALTLGGMRRQPVIEPLTRLLNDPDDSVRANAAYALGQLRHPMSDKLLLTALSDPHPDVRYSAVSALAMVGEPSALPALEALQRDDGVNRTGSKISDEAARAITIIGLRT